ncbi:hypothetical protein B0H14DRAFT_2561726 [Mycena olivaceomarginata]|nr:hypothetical protein B0H14DRAFT_2561726 [Mycena olivaceomarginata]
MSLKAVIAGDRLPLTQRNNFFLPSSLDFSDGRCHLARAPERNINIFQHIAPPNRTSARSLALFTHAPMSEFVYLLTEVGVRALGNETYSLTGGDFGWEHWQALTSRAVYQILDLPGFDEDSDDEDEEEEKYEEPEGTNGKKWKPKPPRGTVKRRKPRSRSPAPPRHQRSVGKSLRPELKSTSSGFCMYGPSY